MITDRIGQHVVLLPMNHKNYNFREKENYQVMKERENFHKKKIDKGVSCLISLMIEIDVVIGRFNLQL